MPDNGENGTSSTGGRRRLDPNTLTILLPAHNEAATIGPVLADFYREVVAPTGATLLVCEDGSTDATLSVLEELRASIPFTLESQNARKGYAAAVASGLRRVTTPYTFFADSDGQYDPADFWKLWPLAAQADMVIGRKLRREEAWHRVVLSRGFHLLAKAVTEVPLQDMDCGFRIVRREVIERVLPRVRSLRFSFWAEFSILAWAEGFRIVEVPVSHRPRLHGETSIYPPRRLPKIVGAQLVGLADLGRRLKDSSSRD
ncbi:MAG: glycosyltransferase family 2 protein [Thermoplasmata archaeon]|nr:glycosyltransferase family 2 protein [Thermoplasmata archaeon]